MNIIPDCVLLQNDQVMNCKCVLKQNTYFNTDICYRRSILSYIRLDGAYCYRVSGFI